MVNGIYWVTIEGGHSDVWESDKNCSNVVRAPVVMMGVVLTLVERFSVCVKSGLSPLALLNLAC